MNRHRPELDGLRGFAAYVVVIAHVSNTSRLWDGSLADGGGQLGVMLFFMLSGFLMGSLYVPRPWTGAELWTYAVHRVARVIPLFYVVVTLALALRWVSGAVGVDLTIYPVGPENAAYHYALVMGVSALWTIPVECQFYVVFVVVWWLVRRSSFLILIVLVPCVAAFVGADEKVSGLHLFGLFAAYFFVGVAISRLVVSTSREDQPGWWSAAFIGAVAFFICLFPNIGSAIGLPLATRWQNPLYLIGVTALFVTTLHAPLARMLFASAAMRFSGRISYSIYLLHLPVLIYLERFTLLIKWPAAFGLVVFALTIMVATLSFHLIEAPAQRALRRLTSRV